MRRGWRKQGEEDGGGTPPRVFLDVWQIKDFKSFVYGSVVNKGVRGHFFRMCGKQRTYRRNLPKTQVFVGLEGRIPAMVARLGTEPHGGILVV